MRVDQLRVGEVYVVSGRGPYELLEIVNSEMVVLGGVGGTAFYFLPRDICDRADVEYLRHYQAEYTARFGSDPATLEWRLTLAAWIWEKEEKTNGRL